MTEGVEIRESAAGDRAAIEALYPKAFPDEDLVPLVRALLEEGPAVLSLVAATGSGPAGHVLFTRCGLDGSPGAAALLAPLCVAPARQRQGIGSALARAGMKRLENEGVAQVFVLGDPAYYGRLGFQPEANVAPPYPLPAEWRTAWQSTCLKGGAPAPGGRLLLPEAWLRPELWAP